MQMSSRPLLVPHSVVTNGDMSASITSQVTVIQRISGNSYDVSWTGAPVGTFSVQISNTYSENVDGSVRNAGNWATVTLSSPITAAGSPDNAMINLAGLECYAVRLVYTRTSGTGTLNAVICGKVQ